MSKNIPDFSDLIIEAANKLDWPERDPGKANNTYCNQLDRLDQAGLLREPLLVTWDDWNLSLNGGDGGWESTAPYIASEEEVLVAMCMLGVLFSKAAECREIPLSAAPSGVSRFVIKTLPASSVIVFNKSKTDSVVCKSEKGIVTVSVPVRGETQKLRDEEIEGIRQVIRGIPSWVVDGRRIVAPNVRPELRRHFNAADLEWTIVPTTKNVCDSEIALVHEALFDDLGQMTSEVKQSILDVIILIQLFFSVDYVNREVESAVYIPSKGFLPVDKSDGAILEERSGGIFIWCSKGTVIKPLEIQAYDTYRGLRTSIVDWTRKHSEEIKERARFNARSAIMSRNLSHNIGSHVLANARLYDVVGLGDVPQAKRRLGDFHSYLQGRLDFIARAMSESTTHPEPMYFIRELLLPFLGQTVLLDTLLDDNGYRAENIEFKVTLLEGEELSFKPSAAGGEESSRSGYEDVLVAVPGGMVGRQALYAFLENLMRNTAKYGARAKGVARVHTEGDDNLIIHMKLGYHSEKAIVQRDRSSHEYRKVGAYTLTVSDSLSKDSDTETIARLRNFLNQDLIDDEHNDRQEGHGVQEMKVCARFLAGGGESALEFPPDGDLKAAENEDSSLAHPLDEYTQYIRSKDGCKHGMKEGEPDNCVKGYHALACYGERKPESQSEDESKKSSTLDLKYVLLMQKPVLLGIVDLTKEAKQQGAQCASSVVFYKDIEALAREPAYFGLILVDAPDGQCEDILNKIAAYHQALPFRLLLVVKEEADVKSWQDKIARRFTAGKGEDQARLPINRLRIILHPKLFDERGDVHNEDVCHGQIVTVYDKWLWAYKGHELKRCEEKCWHLGIGFQRDKNALLGRWNLGNGDEIDLGFGLKGSVVDHLRLHLFWDTESGAGCISDDGKESSELRLWKADKDGLRLKSSLVEKKEQALALDHHHAVLPGVGAPGVDFGESIAAYHEFGGSEQINLFCLLDTPPSNRFARTFLMLSVAEALLTKVVIVDERVGESLIIFEGDDPIVYQSSSNQERRKARMFTLCHVHVNEDNDPNTPNKKRCLSVNLKSATSLELERVGSQDSMEEEGVHLGNAPRVCVAITPKKKGDDNARYDYRLLPMSPEAEQHADVIIIHEGIVDTLAKSAQSAIDGLYQICQCVVRTSGRGSASRNMGQHLPFLEFSELAETAQRHLDKVALARALLSLRGEQAEGEEATA